MAKWADYVITHVSYNEEKSRILCVKQRMDKGDQLGDSTIKTRSEVVDKLTNGSTYITAYHENSKWKKGDRVIAYEIDGTYFIRTDGNKIKKDNLGELSEF